MITVYGIKTCDTCRKAMKWLAAEGIEARFHDFRADGLDPKALDAWIAAHGWETAAQPPRHDLAQAAGERDGDGGRDARPRAHAGASGADQAAGLRSRGRARES